MQSAQWRTWLVSLGPVAKAAHLFLVMADKGVYKGRRQALSPFTASADAKEFV
jgi:hypothetical protein